MKFCLKLLEKVKNQAGATAVIVAIVIPMLIGFGALAVDVGYMHVTKNELQNVADAAALAGTGYLGSIYETISYDAQQTHVFSRSNIVGDVQQVAGKNQAAGINIGIIGADVTIGTWDGDTDTLTPIPITIPVTPIVGPDAVRVIARRDGTANGPILTFFARIFNKDTVNVSAYATAALTGPSKVEKGVLKTPFAISENTLADCTDKITFSPTASSCAAWHNFFDPINAATMPAKMLGLIQGDTEDYSALGLVNGAQWLIDNFDIPANKTPAVMVTQETEIGDSFTFQGGTIASLFLGGVLGDKSKDINLHPPVVPVEEIIGSTTDPAPFPALFDYFRRRDGDGDDSVWTATIPVYEDADPCDNVNKTRKIVAFLRIKVYMPITPPLPGWKTVDVWLDCTTSFTPGRGGGGPGYLKGTIPNLVE